MDVGSDSAELLAPHGGALTDRDDPGRARRPAVDGQPGLVRDARVRRGGRCPGWASRSSPTPTTSTPTSRSSTRRSRARSTPTGCASATSTPTATSSGATSRWRCVRGQDGTPLHFISQILDVTEQHEYEQRLEAANAEIERERQALEAIFETVSVGLLLIGRDGRYERMNRRHQETIRLPFPDGHEGEAGQLGHVYFDDGKTLMAREDMPSYRATQGEEFDDYTYWVGNDPLTRAAFSTSARQVRGPSGERLGAALAYQEITDLMRAMQVKDEFVSSVSHELRTPLTSVLGLPRDALRPRRPARRRHRAQLRVVQRNALRLRALVSDLLQVAQVERRRCALQREPVDLTDDRRGGGRGARTASPSGAAVTVEVVVPAAPRRPGRRAPHPPGPRQPDLQRDQVQRARRRGDASPSGRPRTGIEIEVSDAGMGIPADEIEQRLRPLLPRRPSAQRATSPAPASGSTSSARSSPPTTARSRCRARSVGAARSWSACPMRKRKTPCWAGRFSGCPTPVPAAPSR